MDRAHDILKLGTLLCCRNTGKCEIKLKAKVVKFTSISKSPWANYQRAIRNTSGDMLNQFEY